ncbi:exonuclease [Micromonospora sp. 050-3]|uniref:exonuclease n=1 Tax=Micromonospora sp. 050-3 TaxID=2789265 RepID=UPI003978FFBA
MLISRFGVPLLEVEMTSTSPELYIAVDVEADGPIPGPYSMISLGMAVAGRPDLTFYTELRPISDEFVPAALAVSGLDRDRLLREAPTAQEAMSAAAAWVDGLRRVGRPVFLAAPAVWDGMFVHWYFVRFVGHSPFGATGSGVDLRSYWMGLTGSEWARTRQGTIKHELGLHDMPHTHHAGEDAAELAQVFDAVLRRRQPVEEA